MRSNLRDFGVPVYPCFFLGEWPSIDGDVETKRILNCEGYLFRWLGVLVNFSYMGAWRWEVVEMRESRKRNLFFSA